MLTAIIILGVILGVNVLYTMSCIIHIYKIQKELETRIKVEISLQKMIVELAKHQQLVDNTITELVESYFKSKSKSKHELPDVPVFKSPHGEA